MPNISIAKKRLTLIAAIVNPDEREKPPNITDMYAMEIVTGPAAALFLVLNGGTEYIYVQTRAITPSINKRKDPVTNTTPNNSKKDIRYSIIRIFLAKFLVVTPDARGACGLPITSQSISK